jgi:hypothetical protein
LIIVSPTVFEPVLMMTWKGLFDRTDEPGGSQGHA